MASISILRIPYRMQPIIAVQFRFALQFSILRTPHGMQRGNESYSVISILRIPCGVQRHIRLSSRRSWRLSILRIPCGVQPISWRWGLFSAAFQSYASLAGCNARGRIHSIHPFIFQSYASLAGCNSNIVHYTYYFFMCHCTFLLVWFI